MGIGDVADILVGALESDDSVNGVEDNREGNNVKEEIWFIDDNGSEWIITIHKM